MSSCVVCTSPIRGEIDKLLNLKKGQLLEDGLGDSFETIARQVETMRVEYPTSPVITAADLRLHMEKHPLFPGLPSIQTDLMRPQAIPVKGKLVAENKVRAALNALIQVGFFNIAQRPDLVTPNITIQALRLLDELDKRTGGGDVFVEAISKMMEEEGIPLNSPLGSAPRPTEEDIANAATEETPVR